MNDSLLAGLPLVIAGICGLVRHFLLDPTMLRYPRAPGWLLGVFFLFSSVLIYAGLRFLLAWYLEQPGVPPNAQPMMVVLAWAVLMYKGSMLWNVFKQRHPAQIWERIYRLQRALGCRC